MSPIKKTERKKMTTRIANEERYKLFEAIDLLGCDQIGPALVFDSVTGEFMGYTVALYKKQRLIQFFPGDIPHGEEAFPIEEWPSRLAQALERHSEIERHGDEKV